MVCQANHHTGLSVVLQPMRRNESVRAVVEKITCTSSTELRLATVEESRWVMQFAALQPETKQPPSPAGDARLSNSHRHGAKDVNGRLLSCLRSIP